MKIPPTKISFGHRDIEEIIREVKQVLRSGRLTLDKNVWQLENTFSDYLGLRYAVAVASGTGALEIILRILDVKDKDVIVPTNTFAATAFAVLRAGGKVRFADIEPKTFSIDLQSLKANINRNTKGVIIVHIGGIIAPFIKDIQKICQDNGLFLIEDAAHALGSSLSGYFAGGFSDAAAFSLFATKVMTSAEGGMIVSANKKIYKEALIYRDQGKINNSGNLHVRLGYNWRMSELHAAIGRIHFQRLEENIKKRKEVAMIYNEGIKRICGVSPLTLFRDLNYNYYKYIVILDNGIDRGRLKKILNDKFGIRLSSEVFAVPCHLQPIFKEKGKKNAFPVAEDICRRHICLPVYPDMSRREAEYVITSLRKAVL